MDIIALIVVGAIIGAVARLLMPGRDPLGILGTIVVGIVGVVAGSYLWAAVFGDTKGVEWIGGILTAMALLYLYRRMTYGRSTTV